MGTITSNIGLISGINYSDLVDKLIQVESGPVNNQTARNNTFSQQRTAITSLEASLLALQSNTGQLAKTSLYSQRTATSSNPAVLSATVTGSPQLAQYQVTPVQAAQNQQLQSSRFSSDSMPLGAGTLTLRNGGFVNPGASLDLLNQGQGITRGQIKITDRSGTSAVIDLRVARNVDDVISAINGAGIGVTASTENGHFVLTDTTGQTTSNLKVEEVGGGATAASLGLSGINAAAAQAAGSDVAKLFNDLSLKLLNDGTGVQFDNALDDLQITFRDGTSTTVDFHQLASTGVSPHPATNEQTLADVIDALNAAAPGKLQASIGPDGHRLVLTDLTSDTGGTFSVTDLNNSHAAHDLGLDNAASADTITGRPILAGLKTVLLTSLNGGSGLGTLGTINITDRSGASATVNLSTSRTLDDVITAINATAIGVQAQINDAGNGIEIVDSTGATTSNLIIANGDATNAADKLGLTANAATTAKSSGNLKLQVVSESTLLASLNGGGGVGAGKVRITDTANNSATLTVSSSIKTVGDLINSINLLGIGVKARINDGGDGIVIVDTAHGTGTLAATSTSGSTAKDLHLLGAAQTATIGGVPTQVIDGSTALTISLGATDTLNDLVTRINNAGFGVQAAALSDGSAVKPFRLSLFNSRSGQAGQLLVDASGVNFSISQTVAPQDALVVLGSLNSPDSVLASSPSGTFTNLLPGLSVTALGSSPTPVTLTIGSTNSTLVTAVQNIVDSYNKVHNQIEQLTSFDTTSNTGAILQGDPTLFQVGTDLSNLISGDIFGAGSIQSLAQIGITTAQDGTLQFNQDAFQTVYSQDPQAVQDFLSTKDTGVSDRFKKLIDSLAGAGSSILVDRATTLSNKIDDGQKRIDLLNAQLDSLRQRLTTQFQNSELAIAKIQSNLSAISAIQPFLFASSGTTSSSGTKQASLGNVTG